MKRAIFFISLGIFLVASARASKKTLITCKTPSIALTLLKKNSFLSEKDKFFLKVKKSVWFKKIEISDSNFFEENIGERGDDLLNFLIGDRYEKVSFTRSVLINNKMLKNHYLVSYHDERGLQLVAALYSQTKPPQPCL